MLHRILFVLTSTGSAGDSGEATGVRLQAFTIPYFAVYDAGYHVDVVSTAGGAVPLDQRSLEADEGIETQRYRSDAVLQRTLQQTRSVSETRFEQYDAVFLPGGRGALWDFPHCAPLGQGLAYIFMAGRIVAAACHGAAALLGARLPDGQPLVAGRWIAALTSQEEAVLGFAAKAPILLDQALAADGGRLVKGEPFQPMAIAHGGLISAQNLQSTRLAAGLVVASLRQQAAGTPLRAAS